MMRKGAAKRLVIAALAALAAVTAAGCGDGATTPETVPPPRSEANTANAAHREQERPGSGGGGEASIEGYGVEAAARERDLVVSAFKAYLRAFAAREYGTACRQLSRTSLREMREIAPAQLGRGCAATLSALLGPDATAVARQQSQGTVTKVRIGGSRGFIVFHAPGAKLYQMPIVREGGQWKLGLVSPMVLVPSAATLGR